MESKQSESAADEHASSREDWGRATLSEMIEHIIGHCHGALRDALGALLVLVRRADALPQIAQLEPLVERIAEEFETSIRYERDVLFPWIRAFECARYGTGPWPDPIPGGIRRHVEALVLSQRKTTALVAELGNRARALAPEHQGKFPDLLAAVRLFEHVAQHQVQIETVELFPRVADLEPNRRNVKRAQRAQVEQTPRRADLSGEQTPPGRWFG